METPFSRALRMTPWFSGTPGAGESTSTELITRCNSPSLVMSTTRAPIDLANDRCPSLNLSSPTTTSMPRARSEVATARPATANPNTKVDAEPWVIGTLDW